MIKNDKKITDAFGTVVVAAIVGVLHWKYLDHTLSVVLALVLACAYWKWSVKSPTWQDHAIKFALGYGLLDYVAMMGTLIPGGWISTVIGLITGLFFLYSSSLTDSE